MSNLPHGTVTLLFTDVEGSTRLVHEFGDDFERILSEPDASLCAQYTALLATEGVTVKFAKDGVRRIAEIAWSVNEKTENIGARRLHTVMERLLEQASYDAADRNGSSIDVDAAFVDRHLGELAKDEDLSRYIL